MIISSKPAKSVSMINNAQNSILETNPSKKRKINGSVEDRVDDSRDNNSRKDLIGGSQKKQKVIEEPDFSIAVGAGAIKRFSLASKSDYREALTGKTIRELLDIQMNRGRPLIVARCKCTRHIEGQQKTGLFSHHEFMNGYELYEGLQKKYLDGDDGFKKSLRSMPAEKSKFISEFIARDFEFWAVNPFDGHVDVLMDKSAVLKSGIDVKPWLLATLLSKGYHPEYEDDIDGHDHATLYLIASMYAQGIIVRQDLHLAEQALSVLKTANIKFAESTALFLASRYNHDVFRFLLSKGLNPYQEDDEGDTAAGLILRKDTGQKREELESILKSFGHKV